MPNNSRTYELINDMKFGEVLDKKVKKELETALKMASAEEIADAMFTCFIEYRHNAKVIDALTPKKAIKVLECYKQKVIARGHNNLSGDELDKHAEETIQEIIKLSNKSSNEELIKSFNETKPSRDSLEAASTATRGSSPTSSPRGPLDYALRQGVSFPGRC